jgi:hypothetical protein
MKNNRFIALLLFLGAAALFLAGCSQPPQEEQNAARVALDSARTAEAPVYAPNEWSDADQGFTAAEAKMASKDYDEAKKLYLEVHGKAVIALDAAEKGKAQLTTELDQLKPDVQKKIDQVKADLGKKAKKLSKKDAPAIKAMVTEVESNNSDGIQLIAAGKLMDGKAKLVAASGKADEAASALATAAAPKKVVKKAVKHASKPAAKHTAKKTAKRKTTKKKK